MVLYFNEEKVKLNNKKFINNNIEINVIKDDIFLKVKGYNYINYFTFKKENYIEINTLYNFNILVNKKEYAPVKVELIEPTL